MVVGSYGVAAKSTNFGSFFYSMRVTGRGTGLRCAYRDALTSSSVASRARLETPSLA